MIDRPSASSARARALTSKALSVPIVPIRAATRRADEMVMARASWWRRCGGRVGGLWQQRADRERDVRRSLGQPAHIPRIPGIAVGDERLDPVAGLGETILLP